MKVFSVQPGLFAAIISIFFFLSGPIAVAQVPESTRLAADSGKASIPDTTKRSHTFNLDSFLKNNHYLNTATPVSFRAVQRNKNGKEFLFYVLAIAILLLSMFKVFYARYFNNIFRVFFNTSLRQNQLTDLLLQAKLPSLIFNVFFVISAGLYAWLLLDHSHMFTGSNNYSFISLAVLLIALIYCGKFLSLKLFGWMSGMNVITDRYIFVIFLINKITGILLIPFIILLAFSPSAWMNPIIISSSIIIGILFLLRYLRTYGLMQNEFKINGFHFLLYIVGMELLPILIIYKLIFKVLL